MCGWRDILHIVEAATLTPTTSLAWRYIAALKVIKHTQRHEKQQLPRRVIVVTTFSELDADTTRCYVDWRIEVTRESVGEIKI